ncbi:MAG: response regulator [Immundisolibacteraceae bacterium]|nr:response regulator [Immundisolibacteraceae bacterium]
MQPPDLVQKTQQNNSQVDSNQPAAAYLEIGFESLKFVYVSVPRALILVTLLSTLLVALLWQQVPTDVLLGWWICITIISAVRIKLTRQFFQQKLSQRSLRYWQASLCFWSTLSALIWGLSVWLFSPFAGDEFLPVIMIMLASVCGATATLSVLPRLFLAYSCATLLPLVTWLFLTEPVQGTALGVIVLFYFLFVNTVSRLTRNALQRSIELSNELVVAKEQAEKANRAKSVFLSSMNHELRTPLTAILGFSELLQRADLNSHNLERVNHIKKASEHLRGMIDDILDISRVEAGSFELNYDSVSIAGLITDVGEMLAPLARDHRVEIQVDISWSKPIFGYLDEKKLKQIMLNLTSNAIKYNQPGGKVTLTGSLEPSDRLKLAITDTGTGIDADNLELIFQPFERLDSARSDIIGAGIGLSLCRQLATAMGGTIGVTSIAGEGSTFWVELPLGSTELTKSNNNRETLVDSPVEVTDIDLTIIYIEDNLITQQLLSEILAPFPNLKLIMAADGETGYQAALEHVPDLVLLDLDLPVLSGREVLTRLRENPTTAKIKVVIVSASAMSTDIDELKALGSDGYITKPFDNQRLIELLSNSTRLKTLS